ncbi:MAG: AIR synthase [Clostridiales bacterium]|nr:AIR synthase [Clostridiales bacterium]
MREDRKQPQRDARLAGRDLVAAGYVGLAGTICIAGRKREELLRWFSPSWLDDVVRLSACCGEISRGAACPGQGESVPGVVGEDEKQKPEVWPISEGGILKAIWDFSGYLGVGMSFALRRIPIRQETVEICERYGLNPYRLYSKGCILATAENGGRFADRLTEAGIPAGVIGTVTADLVRRMTVERGSSFLERPRPDEILNLLPDFSFPAVEEQRSVEICGKKY